MRHSAGGEGQLLLHHVSEPEKEYSSAGRRGCSRRGTNVWTWISEHRGARCQVCLLCSHGDYQADGLRYPNRPHNHSGTMSFHELHLSLFNPLNDNKKKTGPTVARAKQGPHGPSNRTPHELRRDIIERFISRWRNEVGDDFYPALRLIIPEKDRDRAMYGLKEKAIGKILVKIMKINKDSDDARLLLMWKIPGNTSASRMAGDFAGRCFEVISKRPIRTEVGNLTIAEVNELLDKLSAAQKEEQQISIFETFYKRMNAEELMWLVRIILRQMKIGATERTFLDLWHPEADALFNVSSSLRRVCWELHSPDIRLDADSTGVNLMECFQPQLAQFQMKSFQKMVDNMRPTEDDPEFWIEEKLDGERMQLHMMQDESVSGGAKFGFWSRKAKDYTYLYGEGFDDPKGSLTRHLRAAFNEKVRNLILDGEMITWDPEYDKMVGFGTLKTAALSEQRNPFDGTGHRPLYRVFDILYLNDRDLTQYTLRDRRRALDQVVHDVHRRLEKHEYLVAREVKQIEPMLRKVVEESSEGLVLKNPRAIYRLNSRNDDWMKVKPEYMEEFGESLDCIVIGGYYGSGHRGGRLSSFLCGLKVDQNQITAGADPQKCYSFFKVGGGFKAEDYASIRHHTDGKWTDWDAKRPPTKYIELGGGDLQYERPDVWIKPEDSIVVSVKAASVGASPQFRTNFTLRFPRFKKLRTDRDWTTALTIQEFIELKTRVDEESKDKEFKVESRNRNVKKIKREVMIAGNEAVKGVYHGPKTKILEGLNFCVLSESVHPVKRSKAELEVLIKANGGKLFQSPTAAGHDIICIADKNVVKVASIVKAKTRNIVKAQWLLDAIKQAETDQERGMATTFIIPFEPIHMFSILEKDEDGVKQAVDEYGDSYARDTDVDELKHLLSTMPKLENDDFHADALVTELHARNPDIEEIKLGFLRGKSVYVEDDTGSSAEQDIELLLARNLLNFAGARIVEDIEDNTVTHVVVSNRNTNLKALRKRLATRRKMPRVVNTSWVQDSFEEATMLDEERYAPEG